MRVEAPRGELEIYLIGNNSVFFFVGDGKLVYLLLLICKFFFQLVKIMKLTDIMMILDSINIIEGEIMLKINGKNWYHDDIK